MKLTWPAPERNKTHILAVLRRVLPESGTLLELASGTGQHAVFFAAELPAWRIIPSDADPRNVASIEAHRVQAGANNLAEPLALDVRNADWGLGTLELDAAFNANMLHIAPWACCEGLFRGLGRHLRAGGMFVLYGPFIEAGRPTAPSNLEFDASLRAQHPEWGVRSLEDVRREAEAAGLALLERVEMPANNLCLVWQRALSSRR